MCPVSLKDVTQSRFRKGKAGGKRGFHTGSPGASLTPPSGWRRWAGPHLHNGRPLVSLPGAGVPLLTQLDICWTTGWSLRPGKPVGALDGLERAGPGTDWLWEFPAGRGNDYKNEALSRGIRETLVALVGSCEQRPLARVRACLF